jgi:hypothetical protein
MFTIVDYYAKWELVNIFMVEWIVKDKMLGNSYPYILLQRSILIECIGEVKNLKEQLFHLKTMN